ncbi:MAG: hypothetical protein A3C90_02345 [Candidatus Magasanikbacteria bacterium RIFCSPHIGHO2_02_FULL_51_14]|uniref:Chromosome partition protein Smc n=1 Tax=Candidatus Magasanikbacteria bacterium RIFCSPHIGHO2_02_FULL_51_14 TaxID=1798683 RepID=A0A1F6MQ58_9BACT|nr:MAG: hypothetical protein A3C90_02345 [Candidatus Magasanikbacteria bacterium RIFCSPHIGHO2_02_FULL_51_14]
MTKGKYMHLKTLDINGFKSFAQRTVLDFQGRINPEKGSGHGGRYSITSIVGPNGSGKSNIADAIRWVMGEQRMSILRAKKGDDIIFGGTDAKGKMGKAEVTMILDNADKRAPIEYEELVITRRFYSTGESEYLVNGNSVRLLDLQILLAQAQFGHGSYGVVGQGMIDEMLLQSSAERKDFFDEASGIKEFQIKRHQAALKLARTREHIQQADLLLNEVSPRLRSLSRQVKKLEQRQEIELSLRELQEQYFTTLFEYNKKHVDGLQTELERIEQNYTKLNTSIGGFQEELAAFARGESRQSVFDGLQRDYQDVMQKKNDLERERAILSGKMQTEYSKAGKQNIGWLENKIDALKKARESAQKDVAFAEKKQSEKQTRLSHDRQSLEEQSVAATALRGKVSGLEQQLTQRKSEQTFFQFTGLKAVQAILEERHQFGVVEGAVAQLGRVDEQFQLAMDVAAGSHISSIVVGDDRVAESCIAYLRKNQLGIATFLPLNKIQPRLVSEDVKRITKEKGVYGIASDLISCDKKFSNIFSYIFGNTLIVDNIDVARRIGIGKVRMVTLLGDVLETSGSMKGGYRKRYAQGLSFSSGSSPHALAGNAEALEEEIASLRKELDAAEIQQEKVRQATQELDAELRIATGEMRLLETKEHQLAAEIASLEQELSLHTMSPGEYDAAMKLMSESRDEIDRKMSAMEKQVVSAQKKIDAFHAEEEKKKQRMFEAQAALQKEQEKVNAVVQEKNQKRVELARFETKQEDLANEAYQETRETLASIISRGAPALSSDALESAQTEIQKLKYTLSLIGGIDEQVVLEYEETKSRHDGLVEQLDDLKSALEDLETLIVELDEMMKKKRDAAFQKIRKEFGRYFKILFDGGKADLVEVYGEEETGNSKLETREEGENSSAIRYQVSAIDGSEPRGGSKRISGKKALVGIDIIANPPGKKIKNIEALSGGEKTLTSLALVCAILHTNPSPFVVLDEVEAALDEANSLRFTNILVELAEQSQFILITHNRATMHASDALYGVTMGNDGMSKLVSVKLA